LRHAEQIDYIQNSAYSTEESVDGVFWIGHTQNEIEEKETGKNRLMEQTFGNPIFIIMGFIINSKERKRGTFQVYSG